MKSRRLPGVWSAGAVFLVGTALAAVWVAVLWVAAEGHAPVERDAFVADYDGRVLDDGFEIMIVQSDGQAFATLARDPLLRRPESFGTKAEASYRAQRPLLPYLAFLASGGRSGWVPPALAAISVLGAGLAASGAGQWIAQRGRSRWLGLVVLALPGVPAALQYFGPEPLVLGLILWALVLWNRGSAGLSAALLTVATVGRESALLVPLVLGVECLWRRQWKPAVMFTAPAIAIGTWWVLLRWRIGAWPSDAGEGRLDVPFDGLIAAAQDHWTRTEALLLLASVLVILASLWLGRWSTLNRIVVVHGAFATVMGVHVWAQAEYFGRVLLPMYAVGLLVVICGFGRSDLRESTT